MNTETQAPRVDALSLIVVCVLAVPVFADLSGVSGLGLASICALPFCWRRLSAGDKRWSWAAGVWVLGILVAAWHSGSSWLSTIGQGVYPLSIVAVAALLVRQRGFSEAGVRWRIAVVISLVFALCGLQEPLGPVGGNPLKTSLGVGVIAVVLLLAGRINRPALVGLLSFSLAAVYLALGARSLGACVAIAGVLGLLARFRFQRRQRLFVLIGALLSAVLVYATYAYLASSGHLGVRAEAEFSRQAQASWGLILGGRPELAVSRVAILASPLLGRGGHPVLNVQERYSVLSILQSGGHQLSELEAFRLFGTYANAHSLLFGAWIVYGAVALLWWLFVWVFFSGALGSIRESSPVGPLLAYGAVQTTWDLLFSPWGARYEFWAGLLLALSIAELRSRKLAVIPRREGPHDVAGPVVGARLKASGTVRDGRYRRRKSNLTELA